MQRQGQGNFFKFSLDPDLVLIPFYQPAKGYHLQVIDFSHPDLCLIKGFCD